MGNFPAENLKEDEKMMHRCFKLARKAQGQVSPNPLVGCAITRRGEILAEAWHQRAGGLHAEALAIEKLSGEHKNAQGPGPTLYCNLEPCCHTRKRTPPCLPLIIQTGIRRVVIANRDPNPQVSGKSIESLKSHGIEVTTGVLEDEGQNLNKAYFKWVASGLPYVHLKWAQTLDGRLSSRTGDSKWISGQEARTEAHFLRFCYDAVLVGRGTVDADDPSLTVRLVKGANKVPWRIVVGLPKRFSAKVFSDEHRHKTLLAIPRQTAVPNAITDAGIAVWEGPLTKRGKLSMPALLRELGQRQITSVLVEGGSAIHTTFLEDNLWDEYSGYISPCLMGNGRSAFESPDRDSIARALSLPHSKFRAIGDQIVVEGRRP